MAEMARIGWKSLDLAGNGWICLNYFRVCLKKITGLEGCTNLFKFSMNLSNFLL